MTALGIFFLAALLEIGGCFAFWAWLRRGAPWWTAGIGAAALVGFALVLTRTETAFAGRAFAAYGGVYIASSLLWLWMIERQRPTGADLVGAAVAVVGAMIIIGAGRRP